VPRALIRLRTEGAAREFCLLNFRALDAQAGCAELPFLRGQGFPKTGEQGSARKTGKHCKRKRFFYKEMEAAEGARPRAQATTH